MVQRQQQRHAVDGQRDAVRGVRRCQLRGQEHKRRLRRRIRAAHSRNARPELADLEGLGRKQAQRDDARELHDRVHPGLPALQQRLLGLVAHGTARTVARADVDEEVDVDENADHVGRDVNAGHHLREGHNLHQRVHVLHQRLARHGARRRPLDLAPEEELRAPRRRVPHSVRHELLAHRARLDRAALRVAVRARPADVGERHRGAPRAAAVVGRGVEVVLQQVRLRQRRVGHVPVVHLSATLAPERHREPARHVGAACAVRVRVILAHAHAPEPGLGVHNGQVPCLPRRDQPRSVGLLEERRVPVV
mmetsp:Transcript_25489/g.96059  ORF Transcript_25489/g.96059 Transcript_25489/m.96059 type:complete len:307 (-) Transcript_25489:706-1626(-)